MPYEDEDPPYLEPDRELNALAHAVIGVAIEVHRQLGTGLDESLYEAGMCVEMRRQNIPFECQVLVDVSYKGELIGQRRIDLLVGGRLVVELNAVETLSSLHMAQVRTYLKLTNCKLGLLTNFNCVLLKDGIKRIINDAT